MYEGHATFQETIEKVSYAFYRYEVKSGMGQLEMLTAQITDVISTYRPNVDQLEEINQLLEMIFTSVVKKDFLIAADLLKYELLGRVELVARSTSDGELT